MREIPILHLSFKHTFIVKNEIYIIYKTVASSSPKIFSSSLKWTQENIEALQNNVFIEYLIHQDIEKSSEGGAE